MAKTKSYTVSNMQGALDIVRNSASEADAGRIKNIIVKLSWSKPKDKIKDQQGWLCVNKKKRKNGTKINLTKAQTSSQRDLTYSSYPNGIQSIRYYVGTKSGTSFSNWKHKDFTILAPGIPIMSEPAVDTSSYDACTFSWSQNPYDNDVEKLKGLKYSFLDAFEWETMLSDAASPPKNDDNAWNTGKQENVSKYDTSRGSYTTVVGYGTTVESSIKIHETQATITAGKYRHFRVRAIGPGGASDWTVRSYRFGNKTSIESTTTTITESVNTGTSGTQEVEISGAGQYVIQFQNAIVVPRVVATTITNGKTFTLNLPVNFSNWAVHKQLTGISTGENSVKESVAFDFSGASDDEVVFLRTTSIQNGEETVVIPSSLMARKGDLPYTLPTPKLTIGTPNPSTHRVEVSISGTRSTVNNAIVAIYYRTDDTSDGEIIHIFESNQSSGTIQAPDWGEATPKFGAKALVADYKYVTSGGVTRYTLTKTHMSSGIDWESSEPPKRPSKPILTNLGAGKMHVKFEWTWSDANSAELSWSSDPDAWMSTDGPSTYDLSNVNDGEWIITGLSAGVWYVKVRLIKSTEENAIYGPYSEMSEQTMSSAPNTPVLTLVPESPAVSSDETITAYWSYESTDGTNQMEAIFANVTIANNEYVYTEVEKPRVTNGDKSKAFKPSDFGWTDGNSYRLAVRTRSSSNILSKNWSAPKTVLVAKKPTISNVAFKYDGNVTALSGTDETRELVKLPLYITLTGGGADGTTTVLIERAQDFDPRRPTGDVEYLFAGETVYLTDPAIENKTDTRTITVGRDKNLIGALDDEAYYYLKISVKDSFGQTAEYTPIKFRVNWDDQALVPSATVSLTNNQNTAILHPIAPTGATQGATCDIYRYSLDGFTLIKEDAAFGSYYADPYPTLGYFGGYRFVYKNIYGDYKTASGEFAWKDIMPYPSVADAFADLREEADDPTAEFTEGYDYYIYDGDAIDKSMIIVTFGGEELHLRGNIALSNTWKKDFHLTRYLGGTMIGDWNSGVDRTGNYTANIPIVEEEAEIVRLRSLADYVGSCRVRTLEGSNFFANVEVTDAREEKWVKRLSKVTLAITRVDEEDDYTEEVTIT